MVACCHALAEAVALGATALCVSLLEAPCGLGATLDDVGGACGLDALALAEALVGALAVARLVALALAEVAARLVAPVGSLAAAHLLPVPSSDGKMHM